MRWRGPDQGITLQIPADEEREHDKKSGEERYPQCEFVRHVGMVGERTTALTPRLGQPLI